MNATNYCADYIESAKTLDKKNLIVGSFNVMTETLHSAVKFKLPQNGIVLSLLKPENSYHAGQQGAAYTPYIEAIKLPYPVIALEFIDDTRNKFIVLARHTAGKDIEFGYVCTCGANSKVWVTTGFFGVIDSECNSSHKDTQGIDFISKQTGQDKAVIAAIIADKILCFIAALQCSNVKTIEQIAPKFINKSRIKKGRQPFFSYKILTIDTKREDTSSKGSKGSHNSPRVHLRRGHIRRLADKTVWVSSCVVGDKSKGIVTKDYRVI